MALIKCKECGQMVSDRAEVCPRCGVKLNAEITGQRPAMQRPAPQPQQSYAPQPEQSYAPQYQQPYASMSGNGGNKNTLLYIVIAVLAVIIVAGAAYFFVTQNNSKIEELQKSQEELASQNEDLATKNQELEDKTAQLEKKEKQTTVIVKEGAKNGAAHRAVSAGGGKAKVVITGTGVRLRFAPSLSAGFLTWENGATRAPKKGAKLDYIGENDDWYEVRYLGQVFYVSKEFSYLEY